ncbi:MAG: hypothetical protein LC713_07500, partial [Actinobacteria bacterium]|nr:hypothetical protein [Actinomycetota bacterium]
TVFFQAGCMALVLWSRDKLADDAGLGDSAGSGFSGIALAYNARSPFEVDVVLDRAHAAGGTLRRRAAPTFYGGYAGYFADPDGHLWEVAHNPGFGLSADGSLTIPNFERSEAGSAIQRVDGLQGGPSDPLQA